MLVSVLTTSLYSSYSLLHVQVQETFSASQFSMGWILSIQYITGSFVCKYFCDEVSDAGVTSLGIEFFSDLGDANVSFNYLF